MKIRFFALFSGILLLFYFFMTSTFSVWSSPNGVFNATPGVIYLNWTNNYRSNITLTVNQTSTENITLEIVNTSFVANYSQSNSQTACQNIYLTFQNMTGDGNIAGPLNGSSTYNSTNFTLIYDTSSTLHPCSPGRYTIGNLMIRNYTNSTENLNITVILDVPISSNSTDYPLSLTTGIGRFAGTIPANATTYHSYYFNATSMNYTSATNITSVTINLTGWTSSQDIDMFLIDASGNLKAKSINKTATSEWLVFNYLPNSAEMWEIRIYGNSTNSSGIPYSGYIIFSTLNLTNSSGNQVSSINFGDNMNVTNTSTVNLILKNEGSINYTDIRETKELYLVQRFTGKGNQNISFFVPNSSIATKVKVSMNWTGAGNYSFNVYKPDGSLILTSVNKHVYANVTNVEGEEYNETTDIGSTAGYWTINVMNSTSVKDDYNLTTFVYVDASQWISSNFSSGLSLNALGISNYTYNFTINLTVPNTTLDGRYEGYIQYRASSGATLRIPIEATTKTGMLLVNNTLGSSIIRIDENIGANLTKVLNVTLNNTGSYGLSINSVNSNGILNLSSSNKNISFSYSAPSSIQARGNETVNITINLNTINTSDTTGVYEGYIQFITNDSHPYNNFTLTLRLNLTNMLIVTFEDISPIITTNTSAENISLRLDVTYVNGTALDAPWNMTAPNSTPNNPSNFSSAWLISLNRSNYRIPTSGSLGIYNKSSTVYNPTGCSNRYCINLSIPSNSPGGTYEVHIFANYTRTDGKPFGGYGISTGEGKYLIINNSGLYMTTNTSVISLYPNNYTYYYVNITNYGPVDSIASLNSINFTKGSCTEYTVEGSSSYKSGSGCSITGTTSYNITIPGNSSCLIWWRIVALSSGSSSACIGYVYGDGSWYPPTSLSASITVLNTTTGTTPSSSDSDLTTTNQSYVANLEFTKAETLIIVQQNSSNSTIVQVNNTGNISQDITFRIEGINSTWFTLNSSSATLAKGKAAAFQITFRVGNVEVKDYSGKYNASSINKTITKDFILRVLPAPSTQSKINETLQLYKTEMLKLEQEINHSKQQGLNVTFTESKLDQLKLLIKDAEDYIKVGDYFSANLLLDDIKSLIDKIKDELKNAKKPATGKEERKTKIILWVGIGIGVVIIVALGYLFWPTKGIQVPVKKPVLPKLNLFDKLKKLLKKDAKYTFKERMSSNREDVLNELKEKWSKIRKKE
ncbi:MAG: hypothetical protein QXO27_03235 [Candidatus Aenigmatarchaeota archaeon]